MRHIMLLLLSMFVEYIKAVMANESPNQMEMQ